MGKKNNKNNKKAQIENEASGDGYSTVYRVWGESGAPLYCATEGSARNMMILQGSALCEWAVVRRYVLQDGTSVYHLGEIEGSNWKEVADISVLG